jgi:hypothetical protein
MWLYLFLIIVINIHHYLLYKNTINKNKDLSIKQRSYILSIQTSIVVFLVALYYNINFLMNGCEFNLSQNDLNLIRLTIVYLTAYFISDNIVGTINYKSQLMNLAGYPHHIFYIILNYFILKWNYEHIFILFLVAELPTILLGMGTYNKRYRNDKLFGLTFFITRILLQLVYTYIFRNNSVILRLSLIILPVHLFWFYNWYNKYF